MPTTIVEAYIVTDDGEMLELHIDGGVSNWRWVWNADRTVHVSNPHLIELHDNGKAFARPLEGPFHLVSGDTLSIVA